MTSKCTSKGGKRLCIAHQSDEGDDDEVIFVGHKGDVATLSLPHFRSMCGFVTYTKTLRVCYAFAN